MRNQQAGTANNSCQYRTVNIAVPPPLTAHFIIQNGYLSKVNGQKSNWQTSAAPHQPISSQHPSGSMKMLYSNCRGSTNMQSGNPCLPATGFQIATEQNFDQNSAQNSKHQTPPNMMTPCSKQDMMTQWNQSGTVHWKQSIRPQDGNIVSHPQHHNQKRLYQDVIGKQIKPYPASVTRATSTAHNRQTAHNQNHRQNATQRGFCRPILPASYSTAVTQSFINNSITTNPSSGGQIWHSSSMSPKMQQYSAPLNSLHNSGRKATSSVDSNSNSCQYETIYFLQQTNECPFAPAADVQQQPLSNTEAQAIARIADNLCKSYPANSDSRHSVHTTSPYKGKQFVGEVRVMDFNQTMQPVKSTVAESYNSNATQLLPIHSGQSLPNTAQIAMTRAQHFVNASPQQSPVADVCYVTTTADGSGSKAGSPKTSSISEGNLVGSLNDASQLVLMSESVSAQRTETQTNYEILEVLSSVKQNDNSIHSSPGCTGTRAVAVVQPLSQESSQVANKHTSSNTINQSGECIGTDTFLSNPQKSFISPAVAKNSEAANLREGFNIYSESSNQMKSNELVIRQSASSNDGTVVSSSDSPGQVCADNKGTELATNMHIYQRVAPAAQQSVTSEMPADREACVFDLSSVPTTPWTISTLLKLVQDGENAQMELEDFTKFGSVYKALSMFWDGKGKDLVCKIKAGWYKDLILHIKEYCTKHLTKDCVVLSQVKQSSEKQLKSYHVLKDSEVYSELPYRSSWLNVNEQVDDIDKEFGFPQYFTHRLHTLESLSLPDQVRTVNSIPAQIASEVPNKVLSQTDLEPVDPGEEKQASTAEALSTQTSSPIGTESDDSGDPYYSFEIQVLPPEQAKIIFEQTQSKIPQSMDVDSEPETVMERSVEDDVPDSELENEVISSIEHICCIDRLREKFLGSSLSKCQCKKEQSDKDCTDRALEKEETTVPRNDKLCVIRSDSKFHSPIQGQDEVKVGKNIDNPVLTCSWPDLYSDLSLSDSDEKPDSCSDKEIKIISQISINNSQSSIILISDTEDDLPTRGSEIPSQIPNLGNPLSDPEDDCVRDQLKSAGSSQSRRLLDSKKQIQKVYSSESASHMSDPEEDCVQAQLTSTDVAESSLETEVTEMSLTGALPKTFSLSHEHETVKRKRKTLSSNPHIFPPPKKLKKSRPSVNLDAQPVFKGIKRKKGFVDAAESEPSASNVRTAELVLFGSAQGKCISPGNRKLHVSSPQSSSDAVQRPPAVLYVTLNPLSRKSSVPTSEYSVKHYIYEKWRRSYSPTKIRYRRKLTGKKCKLASLSGVNLKKAETAAPTNTKEAPGATEGGNGNTKHCLSRSRKRALSNRLRLGEEKKKTHAVALDRSHAVMPLKENSVLRFSVLPNTFNLVDGSDGRKETTDPVSDNDDLVDGKNNSSSNTIFRARDTWFAPPEKKYCPLRSPSVPKTAILFQEFQKKYMERTQPSQAK